MSLAEKSFIFTYKDLQNWEDDHYRHEILSPSSVKRDREIKFKRYGYYGVKEYWIVDPEKQLIEVYDLEQAKLIQVVPKNQILNRPTFPDLNLLLGKIF